MPVLESTLAEVGTDDPTDRNADLEFDLLAFDLWRLGDCPDLTNVEAWEDDVALTERAGCV
jgi:hypothetical protein